MDIPTTVQIFFNVGQRQESAIFRSDTPADQIKDLFRAAAEAGPKDIVKLYNIDGQLLNVCNELEANSPSNPYTLEVVAADGLSMLTGSTSCQLRSLEDRVLAIERQLHTDLPLPASLDDLQKEMGYFRVKLQTVENLSWLGFNKECPEPLSTDECQRLRFRRLSDSVKRSVKLKFRQICDAQVSDTIRTYLRSPKFDASPWDDEELLLLLQQMYVDHDLCSKFAIDIEVLRNFLFEAYKNYNDVPFHNFRHCFCVTQMMYAISWCVDLPSILGDLEVLILLTSCICHDLDHPGFNNIYQINAKTELAIRYNDISPLENHHCSVAFRILENEDCNLFKSFGPEDYKLVREGMIRCILATDMARHNEILTNFREIIPIFDPTDKAHVNLLCMVLIKVSDISNEARPLEVAEPWLDRLLQEFFKQSDTEKLLGLPVTPFMDREKITKPASQCSFIGFVLLPLFEALGELFTELQDCLVQPVRDALDFYRKLNEAAREERHLLQHRKSVAISVSPDSSARASNNPTTEQHSISSHAPCTVTVSPCPGSEQDSDAASNKPRDSVTPTEVLKAVSLRLGQDHPNSPCLEDDISSSIVQRNPSLHRADLLPNGHEIGADGLTPVAAAAALDRQQDDEDEETLLISTNEAVVSERTLKFKISTESSVGVGKSTPTSRKGSRERVHSTDFTTTYSRARGKLRSGAQSFDHNLMPGANSYHTSTNRHLSLADVHLFSASTKRNSIKEEEIPDEFIECHKVVPVTPEEPLETATPLQSNDSLAGVSTTPTSGGCGTTSPLVPSSNAANMVTPKITTPTTAANSRSILSRFRQFADRFTSLSGSERASTLPKTTLVGGAHRFGGRFLTGSNASVADKRWNSDTLGTDETTEEEYQHDHHDLQGSPLYRPDVRNDGNECDVSMQPSPSTDRPVNADAERDEI